MNIYVVLCVCACECVCVCVYACTCARAELQHSLKHIKMEPSQRSHFLMLQFQETSCTGKSPALV